MKKTIIAAIVAATMVIGSSMVAFAGQWQQTDSNWKYQNDDGTYTTGMWQWIDGNNDGVAECYYFDANGYMLANTTTPDGYQVDGNGAWTELGIVRTKATTNTNPVQTEGLENVSIPSGFNENGVSNLAIDILEHTRAENAAKYGESKVWEIAGEYIVAYNNTTFKATYYDGFTDYNGNPNYRPTDVYADLADQIFKDAPMTGNAYDDKNELRTDGYSATTDGGITVVDCGRYECQLKGSSKDADIYIKFDYR